MATILCIALILMAPLASAAANRSSPVRACPALNPVPVDENFLLHPRPTGFYTPLSSGHDTIEPYNPKIVPPLKPIPPRTSCITTTLVVESVPLRPSPPFNCRYSEPSYLYCQPVPGDAANTLSSIGIRIPKTITITVVDTDNRTFAAVGGCLDGVNYEWIILSTMEGKFKVRAATLKGLQLSKEDFKKMASRKIKSGRTTFVRGECPGAGKVTTNAPQRLPSKLPGVPGVPSKLPSKLPDKFPGGGKLPPEVGGADVGQLGEGLSDLFGG